jgi:hypothetical protein
VCGQIALIVAAVQPSGTEAATHPIYRQCRRTIMCNHQPQCPDALAPDRCAARVLISHPEQGWSLLCNGVVVFDDAGSLLPSGQEPPPAVAVPALAVAA